MWAWAGLHQGITSAYRYLDDFFMIDRVEPESSIDPDYTPFVGVALPGTLRRTDRANGWTPGRYYEGDD